MRHHRTSHRRIILISLLLVFLVSVVVIRNRQIWPFTPDTPAPETAYELGAWEWRPPTDFSAEDVREYMEFAATHGIGSIYIDISEVVDIRELPEPEATPKLAEFSTALKQFTQEAHRRGVSVEALAGSVQWSDPDFRYLPLQILDYAAQFNATATPEERLSGIQFDIESYNQTDFDDNQTKVLTDFLAMAQILRTRHAEIAATNSGLRLGFTVPYWYDNENGNIPEVEFAGTKKPVGYHLFDLLNQSDHNYIAIMDYRDTATGSDGSITHAWQEITYANTSATKVKVVIGQLLTRAEPAKTTFYKQDRTKLDEALNALHLEFHDDASFGGFALHDFRGYQKLVDD